MKKLLSLFVFCFWSSVYAQVPTPTDTYNSIVSFQPRIATTVTSELDSIGKVSMQIQYLDGAGQGIQTIHYKASPAGVRNYYQNYLAHDKLRPGTPHFQVLDRSRRKFWYFGTGFGSSLW